MPVFMLETYNPTNNECLPKSVETDDASLSLKMANDPFSGFPKKTHPN